MKLILSFLIVIILAIVAGGVGILGMYLINSADDALYNENVIALTAMGEIQAVVQEQIVQLRNMALNAADRDMIQTYRNNLVDLEKEIEELFSLYETTIVDHSLEAPYFEGKRIYFTEFADLKTRIINASHESFEDVHAVIFNPQSIAIRNSMLDNFDISMENNDRWAKERVDANTSLFTTMTLISVIALIIAVGVALFFAIYISRLISRPLGVLSEFMLKAGTSGDISLSPADINIISEMSQVKDEIGRTIANTAAFISHVTHIAEELGTISNGDLTIDVEVLSDNDVLGVSLKRVEDNLNSMFGEINSSATQVSSGSKQVADGAQALAQGATEQAASIQQLSSSIAEIASQTKQNAEIAEKTSKLSVSIKDSAEKGSSQMDEMITAVKEINDASQSISKIIKTIDDIAFQTNILALNAAVEAARAGQHGKGFAVVAEEVRNLASKSAEAAKDTGNMIQNSMEKAELGTRIAGDTAASLKNIVEGINESSHLVAEIARASNEQSMGISQINTGIDQVAQVVQQNSATAEESAAASEEMSGQSDVLQQLIGQFKLNTGHGLNQDRLPAKRSDRKQLPVNNHDAGSFSSSSGFGKY